MSQITNALNLTSTPNYGLDQILQSTQTAKQPSGFRKFLGAAVGAVGNMFAPGIGGMIGGLIGGGGGSGLSSLGGGQAGLLNDSMQFLQFQKEMNLEQQAYETASAVLKARHDASMAAIRNIN